jgi:hypothetical protein
LQTRFPEKDMPNRMTRWGAAGVHLALTFLVATTVFAIIFLVWYPGVLFESAGGRTLFMLIAFVDATIGPLLTAVVFKPGKKGLVFDLAVIAVLQVAALAYGTWVLFESRPAYIVFTRDRFDLVRANELNVLPGSNPGANAYARPPLGGPMRVGTRLPKDQDQQYRLFVSGAAGQDVQSFPQYYVSYDDVRDEVKAHAAPIAKLRSLNPQSAAEIDRIVAQSGKPEQGLGFLPMRAGKADLAVLVDRQHGDVIDIANLRPWEY